jgi:hypothetical protein
LIQALHIGMKKPGIVSTMSFGAPIFVLLVVGLGFGLNPVPGFATSGGLDANSCHTDRKGGTGYHCHRAAASKAPSRARAPLAQAAPLASTAFRSCAAARAAGAAPLRAGSPGYGRHLDRDGDGVACE